MANEEQVDALMAAVFQRNASYKRKYHIAIFIHLLCWVVIFLLVGALYFLINNKTRPLYFLTDSVGRLTQDPPVFTPAMSPEDVMTWTINAVESAYSYDFVNYRTQLQHAQTYFSEYGWRTYMDGLSVSNNLLALTERKMIFIANVVSKPVIIKQGTIGGAYAWKLQMPILVNFLESPYDKPTFSNSYQLTVVVQRQSLLKSDKGLAILQMIAVAPSSSQGTALLSNPAG